VSADAPDIHFQGEGLSIGLTMVESEEQSGSIRFAVAVNWRHAFRSAPTSASRWGEHWVAHEALDQFEGDLDRADAAVLRDLSGHGVLEVMPGSDTSVLIRGSTATFGYGEGPPAATVTVAADTMKAWSKTLRDFPRWW
jgi:hypothetical protein